MRKYLDFIIKYGISYKGSSQIINPWMVRPDFFLSKIYTCAVFQKKFEYQPLNDSELEEEFTRGGGPGGQSINTTSSCVMLKHIPTGIVVKCQETRTLETNRKRARERLQAKLDLHFNGENSQEMLAKKEASYLRQEKKRKAREKLDRKKAFKEREGLK